MDKKENGTGKLSEHRENDPDVELKMIERELKRLGLRR